MLVYTLTIRISDISFYTLLISLDKMMSEYKVIHNGKEITVNKAYKEKYESELEVIGLLTHEGGLIEDGEVKAFKNKKATVATAPPAAPTVNK